MNAASQRAKRARESRARDTDTSSVTSTSTSLDGSRHRLPQYPSEASNTIKHIKYDAGLYEGFEEKREDDQLNSEKTSNGTNFADIQVPDGAPTDLVCEECERRDAVGYCQDCKEILCAACLAILHIPGTGGQAHIHLAQSGIRTLRAGDESSVMREDEDPIPAHEIDEEEMSQRRDLSVPTSLEAPRIDLTSTTAKRNASAALHTKGQLVVFKAALADCLPDHLADDEEKEEGRRSQGPDYGASLRRSGARPQELYGEVLSVPMARHGEWGHARRRMQGHGLLVRVKIVGRASRGYSEPFVEEWLHRKHRREGPREPVTITGGSGPDPLAREIGAAKVKDMQRDSVRRTMVPPEKELPLERERECLGVRSKRGKTGSSWQARRNGVEVGNDDGEGGGDGGQQPWVVLVSEDQLTTVETKREELKRSRLALMEACCEAAIERQRVCRIRAALERWHDNTVVIRNARWKWASMVLQRKTRGTLTRLRRARQRESEEKALYEAGRRLHKQFRYLDTQELREKAGGGVTTDGRVFLATRAELNRLEALRRVMAERSYRMLCKGVHHAKTRAFKQWLSLTEWERRENETYVFSVAKDASLAGDEPAETGSGLDQCTTDWRHPSHGMSIPPLLRVHAGRVGVNKDGQHKNSVSSSTAATTAAAGEAAAAAAAAASLSVSRKMAGPTPFCSWLMPGSVLMSSYIESEAKARPREFKQPFYPDAASQLLLAGVGTLVSLSSEEAVRQHERDHDLAGFDQAFAVSHKMISAATKVSLGEAKHEVAILRQEEKNLELLRSVKDYDQEERRKTLADIVGRMRIARSAYTTAQRRTDLFPQELKVAWEPLPEDEAPGVDRVIELAVRLEDRLRAGEKLCLWSPRGHGRVGLVGAVLLGRLYGCTADDALLRVQVCHDARESLKGQPQISCPQTIAQVQCVREVLLQMASMYTNLVMRADLPASKRGVKICRCIRGEGPPALRQSDRVPDETQAARYEHEKEHRLQIDHIQDGHQPELLLPLPQPSSTGAAPPVWRQTGNTLLEDSNLDSLRNMRDTGCSAEKVDDNTGAGTIRRLNAPPPRRLVTLGSYTGGLQVADSDVCGLSLPPASIGEGCSLRQPVPRERERARAVAAVPYPTIRSLRKS